MPSTTDLSVLQLIIFSLLVVGLSAVCIWQQMNLAKTLIINSIRCVLQLLFIGYILSYVFTTKSPYLILLMICVMIAVAAHEISQRQQFKTDYFKQMLMNAGSLFIPAICVTLFTLLFVLQLGTEPPNPWYDPRYAIPLLGMILGNSMTGIALGVDRLYSAVRDNEKVIEQQLLLGFTPTQIIQKHKRNAIRSALIPTINIMAVTGVVSIPGMMTGQMLAGNAPTLAAKYQIMIMFLIVACVGAGSLMVTHLFSKYLFDTNMRLRLDRFKHR